MHPFDKSVPLSHGCKLPINTITTYLPVTQKSLKFN